MSGADYRHGFVGGEMRQGFFQRAGKICERGARREAQDGFSQTVDAVSCGFESLRGGIIRSARYDDLQRMAREECGGKTIRRGKHSVLRRDSCERFEGFLRKVVIPFVTGERVHANQARSPRRS